MGAWECDRPPFEQSESFTVGHSMELWEKIHWSLEWEGGTKF